MINCRPDDYFLLYANCIPVKGAARSLICDLQNGTYHPVPNDLGTVLEECRGVKLSEVYASYDSEEQQTLDEYFEYLLENNLGFLDNEPDLFPDLNQEYDFPASISNAIIDLDPEIISSIDYGLIIQQLSELNCFCLEIRCFSDLGAGPLKSLLSLTLNTRLKEVRLVLKYSNELEQLCTQELIKEHKRIEQVLFFDAGKNELKEIMGVNFIYSDDQALSPESCGQICPGSFSVNIAHFTEARHFNSCLNRKVSIDKDGYVKNCPSQKTHYGHINTVNIKEVVMNQKFQHLWKLKKDDIKICQDCEYRYICTDCRVFTQDNQDSLSKPSKCTYDPYQAKWL